MSYSEINSLRKEGKLDEAIALAEKEYSAAPQKLEAITLFWCLNDKIKKIEENDEAQAVLKRMTELFILHDPDNDMLQKALTGTERLFTEEGRLEKAGWKILNEIQSIDVMDIDTRKRLLFQYLQLGTNKKSLLHSRIMEEALKMEKTGTTQFIFSKFADMWGLYNFRDEDWEQCQSKNGHILPSLTERVITSYIKELNSDPDLTASECFRDLLESAIVRYPRNLHLPRFAAQLLARDGKRDEAIAMYKSLIMKTPEKYYLWDDLANLTDDIDLKIGLLCGAITTGAYDEFLPNIRLRLADILCNMQLYGNAKTELDRYQRTHETKNWPLPRRFFAVANRIPHGIPAADNRPLYMQYKLPAQEYIYTELPSTLMVKTWEKKEVVNNKPVISWQLRDGETTYWIKPKRYHLNFWSRNGSVFNVKMANGQIVWASPCELTENLPWVKRATGPMKIFRQPNGRMYAFVDDVFVPSHLFIGKDDGYEATVVAILNGERWSALSLK